MGVQCTVMMPINPTIDMELVIYNVCFSISNCLNIGRNIYSFSVNNSIFLFCNTLLSYFICIMSCIDGFLNCSSHNTHHYAPTPQTHQYGRCGSLALQSYRRYRCGWVVGIGYFKQLNTSLPHLSIL